MLGQIMDKRYQKTKKKNLLPLLKSQEQKLKVESKSRVWCMPSALNTARGMGKIPKPLLCLTPGHTPTLTLCKELARPPSRSEQARELLVCSHYSCCSRGPNKALPGGEKKTIMTSHHIQNKSQYPYNGFSSVQLLSCVRLFVNPWTAAGQASLSITNSQSLLKLVSIKSVMPSNHLILCHPLLLLPSTFPASGSFLVSQFFASGGQSIGVSASASVLPMNIQD